MMVFTLGEGAFDALLKSWGYSCFEDFAYEKRPKKGGVPRSMEEMRRREWFRWSVRENLLRHNRELRRKVQFYRRLRRNRVRIIASQVKRMIDLSSRGKWVIKPESAFSPACNIRLGAMKLEYLNGHGAVVAKGCKLLANGDRQSEIFVFPYVMFGKERTAPIMTVDGMTLSEHRQFQANCRWHGKQAGCFTRHYTLKGRKYETRGKSKRTLGAKEPITSADLLGVAMERVRRNNQSLAAQTNEYFETTDNFAEELKRRLEFRINILKGIASTFGKTEIDLFFSVKGQLFAFSHKPEFNFGSPDISTMGAQLDDWAEKMMDHFNYIEGYWRLTTGVAGTRLVKLGEAEIERLLADINRTKKN